MPKFLFEVQWAVNKFKLAFSEVSGLDMTAAKIEYRHGNSPKIHKIKMPGLKEYSDVTLKKGVFVGQNQFYAWFDQIKLNTIAKGRDTITISLLNEKSKPTMVWKLLNAWPTKVTSTDMNSTASDPAIETLVIAYEELIITNKNNP